MAFKMVNKDASIELIKDSEICIGITVDLTFSTDRSTVMFDALLAGKVKSICFLDLTNKVRLLINEGPPEVNLGTDIVITLAKYHIEIIKDMLLDVAMGSGFVGYHYDIELSHDTPMDLCFLFK